MEKEKETNLPSASSFSGGFAPDRDMVVKPKGINPSSLSRRFCPSRCAAKLGLRNSLRKASAMIAASAPPESLIVEGLSWACVEPSTKAPAVPPIEGGGKRGEAVES